MIVPVTAEEAVEFVKRYHYSGECSPGTLRYGWSLDGSTLLGVTVLNPGTHAMRSSVFGEEHYRSVLHHHRLALRPDAPKLSASQFIGASLRQARKDRPGLLAVITYADLCQGHNGTIYRATNAVYTGIKARGNLEFRTPEGDVRTTNFSRAPWPERRAEAARRGWTEVRCKGKARYVYLLGPARKRPEMRLPRLPYPQEW